MTQRETILTALAVLLRTNPPVPVLRGEVLPERIPPAGLMILRDGEPGEPEVTLSPLTYHYRHRAEIEAVQDGIRPFDDKTALRLHRQVMRLIQLVGDLRASLDAAGTSAPSAQVPVHPLSLLNEALASMRPRLAQAGIDVDTTGLDALTTQVPAQPAPLVRGDAQQLHQVFLNLLENSLRYTDAGGLLRLSARLLPPADGAAQLQVQLDDSAPGVPAHELPRIFDRLYRAETSRNRDHGGSGLGLAICRAIVLAHGGTLTADTSPLGGLRITLQLPLLDNPS